MMKRILLAFAALAIGVSLNAQQALWGGPSVESPVINADGTVTFRYQAPKAVKVEVTGDFLPTEKREFEMNGRKMTADVPGVGLLTEGANGVWEYTTPFVVAPEMYTYTFRVDGLTTIDPNNVFVNRDIASLTSVLLVAKEGERSDLYAIHQVPHGSVSKVWYHSDVAGFDRRLTVYTPAGYETSKAKYPVLYVLHGIGKTDFLIQSNNDFRAKLDAAGYPYTYMETDGGHIWRNWRIYLSEFVPLLFK